MSKEHYDVAAESGWEREWNYIQSRADAPRAASLGCSTVSHDKLGFCSYCVRTLLRDDEVTGSDLELAAWRLLALQEKGT